MMIARWRIEARFGHKQLVIDSLKRWCTEIGVQIGWPEERTRITTGSIGALESTVELEVQIEGLAELTAAWDKLGQIEAHTAWSKEIEPNVVSGTPHWQVLREV